MKHPPRRFFWLLLWLGLALLVLSALSFCLSFRMSPEFMVKACVVETRGMTKGLVNIINGFQTEYSRYPLSEARSSGDDLTLDSANSRLVGTMLGDNLQDNPRDIRFVDLPMAAHGRGGLLGEKGSYRLLDQWGHPYQIILDANGDNQVRNPDCGNTDAKIKSEAAAWLPVGVIVFSNGIDGAPHTADDITSWRAPLPSPPQVVPVPKVISMMSKLGLLLAIIGVAGILRTQRKPAAPSETV